MYQMSYEGFYLLSEKVAHLFVHDCVSVWSTILFIAWPREELQLACAGRRWWGLQLSLLTRRASVCVWGENQRLWCKALSASSLYPLPLLRLEFISLPPFSSQSGKTSPGNSLDYPIIFLLHHGWGEWLKYPPGFFCVFSSSRLNIMASLCPALKYVVPELHDPSNRLVTACHTIKILVLKNF